MFAYYLDLGVRALSRNPIVTALIVLLIERRRQMGARRASHVSPMEATRLATS